MLSVETTRKLLDDPTLSDAEVEEIRDGFRALVEVVFEKWRNERKDELTKP